jgi:hypothetical protein
MEGVFGEAIPGRFWQVQDVEDVDLSGHQLHSYLFFHSLKNLSFSLYMHPQYCWRYMLRRLDVSTPSFQPSLKSL